MIKIDKSTQRKIWVGIERIFIATSLLLLVAAILVIIFLRKIDNPIVETQSINLSTWINNIAAPGFGLAGTFMLLVNFIRQRIDAEDNHNELLKQREESDFLQLIELLRQNKASIQNDFSKGDFFNVYHSKITNIFNIAKTQENDYRKIDEKFIHEYQKLALHYYDYIDHTLLHIDYIFQLINKSTKFTTYEKAQKIKLLCSQLSTNELFIIFYHFYCTEDGNLTIYHNEGFFDRLYQAKPKIHLLDIRHKPFS